MDNSFEYIDSYFQQMLDPEEIRRFEQKITDDPEFADEVAFYLSAKQSLKSEAAEEKKEWFRQLLAQQRSVVDINRNRGAKRAWIYRVAAAAAIVLAFSAWYLFFFKPASPKQMAENYISENFTTLPVKMDARTDSIQDGLRLYNDERYDEALKQFKSIAERGEENDIINRNIGIIYLRLSNYDSALHYFKQFQNDTLYANPSLFYQALTLLKRNLPGDKQRAKELLQQVVKEDLDKKEYAEQWLKKW